MGIGSIKPSATFSDLFNYSPPVSRGGHSPKNSGTFAVFNSPSPRKTFYAFLLLLFAMICNDLSLAWIHERVPIESDPLPDVWFSIFPEFTPAIKITECLIVFLATLTLTICVFHERRWTVLRRVFFIASWVYLGRAFCITVTQVPVPSRKTYCGPKVNETNFALIFHRVTWMMSGLGMELHQSRQ